MKRRSISAHNLLTTIEPSLRTESCAASSNHRLIVERHALWNILLLQRVLVQILCACLLSMKAFRLKAFAISLDYEGICILKVSCSGSMHTNIPWLYLYLKAFPHISPQHLALPSDRSLNFWQGQKVSGRSWISYLSFCAQWRGKAQRIL